jgi:hypothetical protein
MSPVISAVPGLPTWRSRLLIAAVALVAAAGAIFASAGTARADILYNGIYRNWQSGNCLDSRVTSDGQGLAYSIGCNGGNYQNWSIDHVATTDNWVFGFNIIDDATHWCLDTNSTSVYTHVCVANDPNQIWWMYGYDATHQVWGACNFRCVKIIYLLAGVSSLPDSSWVGDGEFVECFAPAHDALSFDEACGLVAAFAGFVAAFGTFAGAFVLDVDDGQP